MVRAVCLLWSGSKPGGRDKDGAGPKVPTWETQSKKQPAAEVRHLRLISIVYAFQGPLCRADCRGGEPAQGQEAAQRW